MISLNNTPRGAADVVPARYHMIEQSDNSAVAEEPSEAVNHLSSSLVNRCLGNSTAPDGFRGPDFWVPGLVNCRWRWGCKL